MDFAVYIILFILGMPTYLVWRRILKKKFTDKRKLRIITWVATITTTPLLYIAIVFTCIFCITYYPSNDFDREKWLSDKEKRYEFSENIIDSKMLIGKTKAEVKEILGLEGNIEERDLWGYYLGYKPQLLGIDPDQLTIQFRDGKVVKVSQYEP